MGNYCGCWHCAPASEKKQALRERDDQQDMRQQIDESRVYEVRDGYLLRKMDN